MLKHSHNDDVDGSDCDSDSDSDSKRCSDSGIDNESGHGNGYDKVL